MKVDIQNLAVTLMTGDKDDYANMLCDFNELIEETIFMLKNPHMFTENDRYDLMDNFRKVCHCFDGDSRATGTLMKHLDINE